MLLVSMPLSAATSARQRHHKMSTLSRRARHVVTTSSSVTPPPSPPFLSEGHQEPAFRLPLPSPQRFRPFIPERPFEARCTHV